MSVVRFVLGVDPGKSGAFVLINENEQVVETWDMNYAGSTLIASATARVYEDCQDFVRAYAQEHDVEAKLEVFIEKAFTMPSDSLSVQQWHTVKTLRERAEAVYVAYRKHKQGVDIPKEHFEALFGDLRLELEYTDWLPEAKYRPDGRVGNFNYAKSAGILECCAALGISYTLVSPKTWCALLHKGADTKAKPKDRSREVIEKRWPHYARKGSPLFRDKGRKMDEGRMDAFMIAIYGLSL